MLADNRPSISQIVRLAACPILVFLCTMVCTVSIQAQTNDRDALPTDAQVRKLIDDKQYVDALRLLKRIESLKGPAANSYDRPRICLLKAECELQLHLNRQAIETLGGVHTQAVAAHELDVADAALALSLLIQESPGAQYRPRAEGSRAPIDILDRKTRESAYSALLIDELPTFSEQGRDARGAAVLTPLLDVATRFAGTRAIERMTTGASPQTDKLSVQLTNWAAKVLKGTLDDYEEQVRRARSRFVLRGPRRRVRGGIPKPTPEELQSLREIIATCDRIPQATATMQEAFAQPVALMEAGTRSENIRHDAREILREVGG